jgi:hypothetical protein
MERAGRALRDGISSARERGSGVNVSKRRAHERCTAQDLVQADTAVLAGRERAQRLDTVATFAGRSRATRIVPDLKKQLEVFEHWKNNMLRTVCQSWIVRAITSLTPFILLWGVGHFVVTTE